VAGLFYDDDPSDLGRFVDELLLVAGEEAGAAAGGPPTLDSAPPLTGILVPHAGLIYSGLVAAAAWRLLRAGGEATAPTVVLLGTNHGAGWLTGVGAWDGGPWRTPLGDVEIDGELAGEVIDLGPPFEADARCHLGEHSLEVQLPFLQQVAPGARVVPLSVGTGTGDRAIEAGERIGALLARHRAAGEPVILAISSDMAHYPRATVAERVTAMLLPHLLSLDPAGLAAAEARVRRDEPRTSCGMCGVEPAVLGLAALRAMGAGRGVTLASATSADAGGDPGRTVGYLAIAYPAG
jgi:AmmeMemoRadiSam system protein B